VPVIALTSVPVIAAFAQGIDNAIKTKEIVAIPLPFFIFSLI